MSGDKEFVNGLFMDAPHENAPDFVIANGSIKRDRMIDWLNGKDDEWVKFQVTKPKNVNPDKPRRLNAFVDTWQPKQGDSPAKKSQQNTDFDDEIPF